MKTSVFSIVFKIFLFIVLSVVCYKVTLSPVFAGCCTTGIDCVGSCKDTPIGCAKSALVTMRDCDKPDSIACVRYNTCPGTCRDLTTEESFSTCGCTPADCAAPPPGPTATPTPIPTPTAVPTLPSNCTCGSWASHGCGEYPCSENGRRYTRTCTPSGCGPEVECRNECNTSTMYACARCSIVNGCEWTEFQSYRADCSTVDSAVTRTTSCNCPAISGKDNSRCAVCPANCKDLTGPSEVVVGGTYTYTATYENGKLGAASLTDCALAVLRENSCPSNIFYYWDKSGCAPGTRTYTWTPNTTGYFDMECRAWNDGNAECRGKCATAWPIYACEGPTAYKTIHVILPSPTPTPVNSPPSAPTLSSPADGSTCQNTSITLYWNGVSSWGLCRPTQNNHYLVYLGNSGFNVLNGASTTSTSYSVNLSPGTTYWWRVETDNGCLRNASSIWSFTTKPNPPAAPNCDSASCNLAPGPEIGTTCTVEWSNVAGAVNYPVRIDNAPDSWSGNCNNPNPPNFGDFCENGLTVSSFSFTGFGGRTYKPWFHAKDSCDQWSPPGYCPNFTALACPAAPSNMDATRNGCDARLTWTDNSSNEESFMIQRARDGGGFSDWRSVAAGVTTTTDTNVFCGSSPAASAQYRISAVKTGCPPVYSNTATASCPLDATTTSLIIVPDPSPDIVMGKTVNPYFSYDVVLQCGTFDHIEFSYDPSRLANVTPASSNSEPGIVSVTAGMTPGNTIITAKVYLKPGPVLALTKNTPVNVIAPPAWWQTKDGDVHADGSITSLIPLIAITPPPKHLSLVGDGGDPGVVSYGGSISLDAGSVSSKGWQAQTTYHEDEVNFDYLMNRLNVDTTVTFAAPTLPTDSKTYYLNGPSEIDGVNIGTKKIVVFVNGDATVKGDITVDNGGFFAVVAKGNITFNADVKEAHGFYLADNVLSVASGSNLFEGEGSFIGWNGVDLQRDLGASSFNITPSELFTFRPDLLINAPKEFLFTPFVFQEVAP